MKKANMTKIAKRLEMGPNESAQRLRMKNIQIDKNDYSNKYHQNYKECPNLDGGQNERVWVFTDVKIKKCP